MARIRIPSGYFHYNRKNLYLGLKQIDREIAIGNLMDFVKLFNEIGIHIFPIFGTLLGIIRENNLIEWDEDIDMGIFEEDEIILLQNLEKIKSFGFELVRYERIGLYSFMKNGEYIDIYVLQNIGYGILTTNDTFFFEKDFKNTIEYDFKGITLSIPQKAEDLLEFLYGDWRTPIKYTNYNLTRYQKAVLFLKTTIKNNLPNFLYYPLLKRHHKKDFEKFIKNCEKHNIILDKGLKY